MPTIQELVQAEQKTQPEVSNTEVNESGNIEQNVANETTVAQENNATQEENVVSFSMPSFDEETDNNSQSQQQEQNNQPLSLDKIDKNELYKAAGLDEYDIEFINYRKSGGDPLKYIEAKSFDWDKVNDIDVIRNEYRKQFPSFENQDIERLIVKKYGFVDGGDETDNADAFLMIKADAHIARQKNKEEQKKFQLPTVASQNSDANLEQLRLEAEKQQFEEYQAVKNFYENHEVTKALMESKRVAVKFGDKGSFNFNIDKPELLVNLITDSNSWQKITSTKQGEPDVEKLQRIALYASNPNYDLDIYNYAFAQGRKSLIEEGQNAKRPVGQQPSNEAGKGLVIKGTGTLKQHLNGN